MKALVISDLHGIEKKFRQVTSIAEKRKPDFIITCGDDTDKRTEQGYEADIVLSQLMEKEQQEEDITPEEEVHKKILLGFQKYFAKQGKDLNKILEKTDAPIVGTAGNHDPVPALKELAKIKYLFGETAEVNGMKVSGLPATYEFVSQEIMQACAGFYPHLFDSSDEQVSGLAKKILDAGENTDILVTHKAAHKEGEPKSADFGIDAGASAVVEKYSPALNVFGHYHKNPSVKRSKNGKTFYLCTGPNAAVEVSFGKDKKPESFESIYYN